VSLFVMHQRKAYRAGTLSEEKRTRLLELGFVFQGSLAHKMRRNQKQARVSNNTKGEAAAAEVGAKVKTASQFAEPSWGGIAWNWKVQQECDERKESCHWAFGELRVIAMPTLQQRLSCFRLYTDAGKKQVDEEVGKKVSSEGEHLEQVQVGTSWALAGLPQNRSFSLSLSRALSLSLFLSLSLCSHIFSLMLWLLVLPDILHTMQQEVCEDFEWEVACPIQREGANGRAGADSVCIGLPRRGEKKKGK
jgi:hypothetical protein